MLGSFEFDRRALEFGLRVADLDRKDFPAVAVGVADPDLVLQRETAIHIHLILGGKPGLLKALLGGQDRRGGFDLYAEMVQRAPIGDLVAIV